MKDKNFKDTVNEFLEKESKEPVKLCYMSFVDPDRPVGTKFLGGIFTHAKGITHAIQKTHALEINPGGEVLYTEAPDTVSVDQKNLDRLLTREEVESL